MDDFGTIDPDDYPQFNRLIVVFVKRSFYMNKLGIRMGDEVTVVIYRNKEAVGEVVSTCVSDSEIIVNVTVPGKEEAIYVAEALKMASSALDYHTQRPVLRKMLEKRIAELRDLEDEAEGEPPYPIDVGDIPF